MKDLRIYDFDFNLLAVESKIISSNRKTYFRGRGTAEIHLPKTAKCIKTLFENRYLLMTQGDYQAIITGKQIGSDCVIYAKTPEWILSKRVLKSFEEMTEGAESFVRRMVRRAFSDCDNFILGEICGIEDEVTVFEESYCVLESVIKDVLKKCDAGYKVSFDIPNRKWVFKVIKGIERPILIAEDCLNASNSEYIFDIQDYISAGFYERELNEDESENGQKTLWTEIIKDKNSGILRWEKVLSSYTESDAKREVDAADIEESITARVRNLQFGKDYGLGDVVMLSLNMNELKRTKKYRITGVEIWEESGDEGEQPIFEEV